MSDGSEGPRLAGYPAGLEADIRLADGRRVHVRPILPSDAPALREAIEQADEETIRLRFLGGRPPLTPALLRHLTEVDYDRRLALVAFDPSGRGVGIARYEGREGSAEAEIAVAVAPEWRGVGLATRLLALLGHAAIVRGVERFTASYYSENRAVSELIEEADLPTRTAASGSVVEDSIDLPTAGG